MTKPKAIDLFAGCGGLTEGLRQAGFRVIGAIESNKLAVKTYKANHKNVRVWQKDIRKVSIAEVKRKLKLKAGDLDLLAGCPPCQGFSTITTLNGNQKRSTDDRNELIFEFLRFVRNLLPKAIMLENVPRLATNWRMKLVLAELRRLGYECSRDVLDAADYGVPQRRRRFILLAGRRQEIPFAPEARSKPVVRDAIGQLSKRAKKHPLHNYKERRSAEVMKRIKRIPPNGGSRSALGKRGQLPCHKEFDGFKDIYGRMAWDEVAPTITTGCFNPSKGRFLHPTNHRAITLREAALLQSFPISYVFLLDNGRIATAEMIGNALPPEFVRRHALQIIRTLEATDG
ncbi:MAG TPA: DNA cytosine methyltransferase [Pyrinomonadaceae bacterium]|nr:DNA cytosine methyltransferase [Pyrinomonadaceae bacterium]